MMPIVFQESRPAVVHRSWLGGQPREVSPDQKVYKSFNDAIDAAKAWLKRRNAGFWAISIIKQGHPAEFKITRPYCFINKPGSLARNVDALWQSFNHVQTYSSSSIKPDAIAIYRVYTTLPVDGRNEIILRTERLKDPLVQKNSSHGR